MYLLHMNVIKQLVNFGKCPIVEIFTSTFKHLLEITVYYCISPIVALCSIRTFTNPCQDRNICKKYSWMMVAPLLRLATEDSEMKPNRASSDRLPSFYTVIDSCMSRVLISRGLETCCQNIAWPIASVRHQKLPTAIMFVQ